MKKRSLPAILSILVFALAFLVSGCSAGARQADDQKVTGQTVKEPTGEATGKAPAGTREQYLRSDSEGRIEVEVLWIAPGYVKGAGNPVEQYDPEKYLIFDVGMTTHSGDLLSYDMLKGAVLRAGDQEIAPSNWEYVQKDSHHPEGVLVFPRQTQDGKVFPPAESTAFTLVLKNLNGVPERVFTFEG